MAAKALARAAAPADDELARLLAAADPAGWLRLSEEITGDGGALLRHPCPYRLSSLGAAVGSANEFRLLMRKPRGRIRPPERELNHDAKPFGVIIRGHLRPDLGGKHPLDHLGAETPAIRWCNLWAVTL